MQENIMKWLLELLGLRLRPLSGPPGGWHKRWQCPKCFRSERADFNLHGQWAEDLVCQGCGEPFNASNWIMVTARRKDISQYGEEKEFFEFGKIISNLCPFCGTSDNLMPCPKCGARPE